MLNATPEVTIATDLFAALVAALKDAQHRLDSIARLANGESEEIYQTAYSGNVRKALRSIGEA